MGPDEMIYLVTSGRYSDYHVAAAFSTKEKAEEYLAKHKATRWSEGAVIEEYMLDASAEIYTYTLVQMTKEGETRYAKVFTEFEEDGEQLGFVGYSIDLLLTWKVDTDDEKRAIKVVNEKRTQILANELWGNIEATREYFGE